MALITINGAKTNCSTAAILTAGTRTVFINGATIGIKGDVVNSGPAGAGLQSPHSDTGVITSIRDVRIEGEHPIIEGDIVGFHTVPGPNGPVPHVAKKMKAGSAGTGQSTVSIG
tara:strand:- start:5066 stop:5407 length:342 start_codon:yes stop_codon:yes gene_type:complete